MKEFNLKGAVSPSPRYWWLNEESETILDRGYLITDPKTGKKETVQEAVLRVTTRASEKLNAPHLQPLFQEMVERGWMSLSSPIWANFGAERGLNISCFGSYVDDTMLDIINKGAEVRMQTSLGGGTSGYFGNIRPLGAPISKGGKAGGPVEVLKDFESAIKHVSQSNVRRGAFASYLDIDHPDVREYLKIRDIGNEIQNLLYAVCVPDAWMQDMIKGNSEKRDLWAQVLKNRQEKGVPYIFFSDNVNNNTPEIYKKLGLVVNNSNLCSEVLLFNSVDESFVCCLSSMNLDLYDEWKGTDAVQLATWFLDANISEFVDKTKNLPHMETTHRFAKRHRALGLGVMGYHSYLQKNMIPFDSWEAKTVNTEIFSYIQKETKTASIELAEIYGPAPIFLEEGAEGITQYRNTHTMAIAPTTSSSAILGQVSAGIEPLSSNYYKAGLAKGSFIRKNKYLEKLLESKNKNTQEVWQKIMMDGGSVSKLDFLTQKEKDIFKTFKEINQAEILNQAVSRQRFIDQGQSLNVNIPPSLPLKEVNKLYVNYWQSGGKTLYYQRSQSVAKELVQEIASCSSCEA